MTTALRTTASLVPSVYHTTEEFRSIDRHCCIARQDGSLVAVCGPAGDAESQQYADLFSAAPELLAAAEYCVQFGDSSISPTLRKRLKAAIELAKGIEPHAAPGEFCPSCGEQHCNSPSGHKWGSDDFCVHCGADGRC